MERFRREIDIRFAKRKEVSYSVARSYRKSKAKQYNIKDKDRNVFTEQEDIDNTWREYFDELLNADEQEYQDTENLKEEENDEITREEYEWTLKECKNSSAPRIDEIQICRTYKVRRRTFTTKYIEILKSLLF